MGANLEGMHNYNDAAATPGGKTDLSEVPSLKRRDARTGNIGRLIAAAEELARSNALRERRASRTPATNGGVHQHEVSCDAFAPQLAPILGAVVGSVAATIAAEEGDAASREFLSMNPLSSLSQQGQSGANPVSSPRVAQIPEFAPHQHAWWGRLGVRLVVDGEKFVDRYTHALLGNLKSVVLDKLVAAVEANADVRVRGIPISSFWERFGNEIADLAANIAREVRATVEQRLKQKGDDDAKELANKTIRALVAASVDGNGASNAVTSISPMTYEAHIQSHFNMLSDKFGTIAKEDAGMYAPRVVANALQEKGVQSNSPTDIQMKVWWSSFPGRVMDMPKTFVRNAVSEIETSLQDEAKKQARAITKRSFDEYSGAAQIANGVPGCRHQSVRSKHNSWEELSRSGLGRSRSDKWLHTSRALISRAAGGRAALNAVEEDVEEFGTDVMKRISTRITSEVERQAEGIVESVAREHLDTTKIPKGPKEVPGSDRMIVHARIKAFLEDVVCRVAELADQVAKEAAEEGRHEFIASICTKDHPASLQLTIGRVLDDIAAAAVKVAGCAVREHASPFARHLKQEFMATLPASCNKGTDLEKPLSGRDVEAQLSKFYDSLAEEVGALAEDSVVKASLASSFEKCEKTNFAGASLKELESVPSFDVAAIDFGDMENGVTRAGWPGTVGEVLVGFGREVTKDAIKAGDVVKTEGKQIVRSAVEYATRRFLSLSAPDTSESSSGVTYSPKTFTTFMSVLTSTACPDLPKHIGVEGDTSSNSGVTVTPSSGLMDSGSSPVACMKLSSSLYAHGGMYLDELCGEIEGRINSKCEDIIQENARAALEKMMASARGTDCIDERGNFVALHDFFEGIAKSCGELAAGAAKDVACEGLVHHLSTLGQRPPTEENADPRKGAAHDEVKEEQSSVPPMLARAMSTMSTLSDMSVVGSGPRSQSMPSNMTALADGAPGSKALLSFPNLKRGADYRNRAPPPLQTEEEAPPGCLERIADELPRLVGEVARDGIHAAVKLSNERIDEVVDNAVDRALGKLKLFELDDERSQPTSLRGSPRGSLAAIGRSNQSPDPPELGRLRPMLFDACKDAMLRAVDAIMRETTNQVAQIIDSGVAKLESMPELQANPEISGIERIAAGSHVSAVLGDIERDLLLFAKAVFEDEADSAKKKFNEDLFNSRSKDTGSNPLVTNFCIDAVHRDIVSSLVLFFRQEINVSEGEHIGQIAEIIMREASDDGSTIVTVGSTIEEAVDNAYHLDKRELRTRQIIGGLRKKGSHPPPSLHDLVETMPDVARFGTALNPWKQTFSVQGSDDENIDKIVIPTGVWATGAPLLWSEGHTGHGARVAILDGGVDRDHPDLRGKVVLHRSYVGEGQQMTDNGTHVAGIIAADGQIKGVAPDADLYDFRVLDDKGHASIKAVTQAIYDAVDMECDVICLSLGSETDDEMNKLHAAIKYATNRGAVCVAASGSNIQFTPEGDSDAYTFPACCPEVLSVGAVDYDAIEGRISLEKSRSRHSGRNAHTDCVAVGYKVLSTVPGDASESDGHDLMNGAAQACAHVAGAAALLLSKLRSEWLTGAPPAHVLSSLVKSHLKPIKPDPTKDVDSLNTMTGSGFMTFFQTTPSVREDGTFGLLA